MSSITDFNDNYMSDEIRSEGHDYINDNQTGQIEAKNNFLGRFFGRLFSKSDKNSNKSYNSSLHVMPRFNELEDLKLLNCLDDIKLADNITTDVKVKKAADSNILRKTAIVVFLIFALIIGSPIIIPVAILISPLIIYIAGKNLGWYVLDKLAGEEEIEQGTSNPSRRQFRQPHMDPSRGLYSISNNENTDSNEENFIQQHLNEESLL